MTNLKYGIVAPREQLSGAPFGAIPLSMLGVFATIEDLIAMYPKAEGGTALVGIGEPYTEYWYVGSWKIRTISGDTVFERCLLVDPSRPIAYTGYTTKIKRLDYGTDPPIITSTTTTNLSTDWPNRQTLTFN